jgi:hypothetical protein
MAGGGDLYGDYYGVMADDGGAAHEPESVTVEREFVEDQRSTKAADAYAEIAKRLREIEAERAK